MVKVTLANNVVVEGSADEVVRVLEKLGATITHLPIHLTNDELTKIENAPLEIIRKPMVQTKNQTLFNVSITRCSSPESGWSVILPENIVAEVRRIYKENTHEFLCSSIEASHIDNPNVKVNIPFSDITSLNIERM